MKRHVFVAMPAYSAQVWVPTMRCLFRDFLELGEQGITISFEPIMLNGVVAHARSCFISLFLASDATDLISIDTDVAWNQGALLRLINHPADVVGADYPHRMFPVGYATRLLWRDGKWHDQPNEDGLLEVEKIPAGLMKVSRAAVQRMVNAYPELKFDDPNLPGGESVALYHHILENRKYWAEDYSFCRRWRDIGGSVWVDTRIKAYHHGQWTFAGDFTEWLKVAAALPSE